MSGKKFITLHFPNGSIEVAIYKNRSGRIESHGIKIEYPTDEDSIVYNAAWDGIESFLLALACEGVDLLDSKIKNALQTVLDVISNNM